MKLDSFSALCAATLLFAVVALVTEVSPVGTARSSTAEILRDPLHKAKSSNSRLKGSLVNFQAPSSETLLLADDFSESSIDTTKWSLNDLFSGFTSPTVSVSDNGQELQIGPLKQSVAGSNYNGLRSAISYNFTGAYCYVELTGPPSSSTAADAMFTLGTDVNNYYRIYVEAGMLICQKKAGGAKTNLLSIAYDPGTNAFWRIRNDAVAGDVVFETSPDMGGAPGTWTELSRQTWDSSIQLTDVLFEIKAGTWRAESSAPGTVSFDNFRAAIPSPASAPSLVSVLPAAGSTAGGTEVSVSGSGFSAGATVTFGGVAATNVVVNSTSAITAVAPPHSLGPVDLMITNPDGQAGVLANGYTYTNTPASAHVFLVVEENHSYSSVIGNAAMPYLNSLASKYGLATEYFANTHPSIGNYFMLTTGQLVTNDDSFAGTVSADNVVREAIKAGKTWKTYAESLPSAGYLGGDQYPYLKHHNPAAYFSDVVNSSAQAGNLVPFSQLGTDLAAGQLPAFSLIIPNAQDDAHDCPQGLSTCTDSDKLSAADAWLQNNISSLIDSTVFQDSGLMIIVFDESVSTDTASGGGHVAMVLVSSKATPSFLSTTFYQHQSALKTLCEAAGLGGFPGASAAAPDMSEFFAPAPSGTTLLADDFSEGFIDTSKWSVNSLFSGFTDSNVPVSDSSQELNIGPLQQNGSGSHYNGLRSASAYDFTGAYCYVQLVQAPSSSTAADAMLTIGKDVNNYYRMFTEAGSLICQKRIGGAAKVNLFTGAYNAASQQFLRIRHDSATGNVVFETAPNNSGSPGAWSALYSEAWNTGSVPLSAVLFEIKAGTWRAESNAPGTVIFDNFRAAKP